MEFIPYFYPQHANSLAMTSIESFDPYVFSSLRVVDITMALINIDKLLIMSAMMQTVAIIGAGFSGVSLAYNLSRLSEQPITILLFEKQAEFGLGAAYSTKNPIHLLNVTADNMSALPDQPNHFVDWLLQSKTAKPYIDPNKVAKQYVPRMLYGLYLQDLLKQTPVTRYHSEVIDVSPTNNSAEITMSNNETVTADKVILACGNFAPVNLLPDINQPNYIVNPWDYAALETIPQQAKVFILGTGLTMVDVVLTLYKHQHQGYITALSRRGISPRSHQEFNQPYKLKRSELPNSMNKLIHYLRNEIATFQQQGGDWRAVIKSLRPVTQHLWQSFSLTEKKQFLRHFVPYWDNHRHRIAKQVAAIIDQLKNQQQLSIKAGRLVNVNVNKSGFSVDYRPRHSDKTVNSQVDYIINCTGPNTNIIKLNNPLLSNLFKKNLISSDHLKLGFTINSSHQNFYTLGPPTKCQLWEIIAVPDIRQQSYQLARSLLS